jgi:hypothetical protein
MPLTTHPLPFGLRDVKLKPITPPATLGAAVDLPVARTFSFSESEDFEELQGDDVTAASHGSGPTVEWELESGGLPFEAFKVMAGGTITESGTTPAMKKTYSKLATDARPYFQVEGQAISDSGGDVHGIVYRCKADGSLEGEFGNGAFFLLSASGKGYGDTVGASPTNKLYDFVQNETAVAIT